MIRYQPDKLLEKIAPKTKIKKILKGNISLKKTALRFIDAVDFIDKANVVDTALKVIKGYRQRIKDDPSIEAEILKDPKQLIQRVQNEVVLQISQGIRENYQGEKYVWLASDADEPRPEHQLNYGKTFDIGDGEQPGDDYGCRCGMEILVADSSLKL